VCLFDRRSSYARKTLGLVRSTFNYQVYNAVIGLNTALREATSQGKPVRVYNKYASSTVAYDALADEILHDPAAFDTARFFAEAERIIRRVQLSLEQPQATTVHLVGDFNGWTVNAQSVCERQTTGRWHRPLELNPGRYRYQFVVDGRWMPDPTNPRTERNPFGSVDSVLIVE